MIVELTPIDYRKFMWHSATDTFVAEASELPHSFERVYDDSCDEGLAIRGKTGRVVVFVVEHVELDREREIIWWSLAPADPRDRGLNVKVKVFND